MKNTVYKNLLAVCALTFAALIPSMGYAASNPYEDLESDVKQSSTPGGSSSSTTQKVGGLLFDVDEGVKIEQGPGGSVYIKSNKEAMQEKFGDFESRIDAIEARLEKIETFMKTIEDLGGAPAPSTDKSNEKNTRVLVT